jgi:hypothetical protein
MDFDAPLKFDEEFDMIIKVKPLVKLCDIYYIE